MNKKLRKKPLTEALVELKWRLVDVGPGQAQDPGYPLYVGRFFEVLKDSYPFLVKLPAAEIPDQLTPHVVKFQFRRAPGSWPVVQCGPGVATINFTKEYEWETFRAAATEFYVRLLHAYLVKPDIERLQFQSVVLRYLNVLDKESNLPSFLERKLHTRIELPDDIARAPHVNPVLESINLAQTYALPDISSTGLMRMADGTHDGRPAFILDFQVQSTEAPQTSEAFGQWLSSAHETLEAWFFALIRGELEKQFEPISDAATA